jgi:hypothetical protein
MKMPDPKIPGYMKACWEADNPELVGMPPVRIDW